MTKKDYIKFASIIKGSRSANNIYTLDGEMIDWYDVMITDTFVSQLCEYLKEDNPLFNQEKFIKAINS